MPWSRLPSPSSNNAPLTTLLLLSFLYLLSLSTTTGFSLIISRSRLRLVLFVLVSWSLDDLSFRRFSFAKESADRVCELVADDGVSPRDRLCGLSLRGLRLS